MNFKEAFKLMKQGAKVKLPGWGGFWYWDAEKKNHYDTVQTSGQ